MKLSNTIFDLSEYIEPYPYLERVDGEAVKREFNTAHDRFNKVLAQDNKSPTIEFNQTINSIKDADSSSKSWIFRSFDQPTSVQKFYANKMNRSNWSIVAQSSNSMHMRNGRMMLKILFPKKSDGTLLIYFLNQSR